MRIIIPAYHDDWIRGDRCGEVIGRYIVSANDQTIERYRVKLDKSGRKISVNAEDCQIIDMG
jgi:hypothetical protein